jgi:hypothetical protein
MAECCLLPHDDGLRIGPSISRNSHRLEQVHVRPAHGQLVVPARDAQEQAARVVAPRARLVREVHGRRAVDLLIAEKTIVHVTCTHSGGRPRRRIAGRRGERQAPGRAGLGRARP